MSSLFGHDDDPPAPIIQMREPQPPAPIPRADPNDPVNREARRRAQAAALAAGGRASTLLSPSKSVTGARPRADAGTNFDSYASTRLGTGA
jgi:hypothetical protein